MSDKNFNEPHQGVRNLVKINDLPIYPERKVGPSNQSDNNASSDLEEKIRNIRQMVAGNFAFLDNAFQASRVYYHHGVGKSKEFYANLTNEKEQTTKLIAITSGGIIGLILSRKKGLFKKAVYTSTISGAIASFCYPAKSKEYTEIALYITKNRMVPMVKDYTGVDLNEQFKNLRDALPDLSFVKKFWNFTPDEQKSDESTKTINEKR